MNHKEFFESILASIQEPHLEETVTKAIMFVDLTGSTYFKYQHSFSSGYKKHVFTTRSFTESQESFTAAL